jgi:hypothetical protein
MSTGKFINFVLPFKNENGKIVPPKNQAEDILRTCSKLINKDGSKSVGIIYSANYGQTRDIEKVYFAGGWNTQTGGANQGAVISEMEALLGSEYKELQGKMHILPITTMNAYTDAVHPWNENVHLGIVITDLDRINNYLQDGWDVLGWQNQDTENDRLNPYAIGGSISGQLPTSVSDKIQSTLIGYAKKYPGGSIEVK